MIPWINAMNLGMAAFMFWVATTLDRAGASWWHPVGFALSGMLFLIIGLGR